MHLGNAGHLASLRLSLLAAIGFVPLACGGSTQTTTGNEAGGTNATGGKGGTVVGVAARSCTSPKIDPITQLVTCEEGYSHRPKATQCQPPNADAAPAFGGAPSDAPVSMPRASGNESCEAAADDAQCTEFEYGFCRTVVPSPNCFRGCCFSGCVEDADCGKGQVCLCGSTRSPTGGECVRGDCATDDDCAAGFRCATVDDLCGDSQPGFTCQRAEDQCNSAADCDGQPCSDHAFEENVRACFDGTCGRPFLVEAEARVAPVTSNTGWLDAELAQPSVAHLTTSERAALAQHWQRLGQMEHASVAAFARFSLQLMALGAPSELVERCTQALADETEHAKLCFQLASSYAGEARGPGPLDIAGSLSCVSLGDVVDLVLIEGCFGETSAALEALEAADTATDPVVRAVYARIARDEQRHAELAFRFLRWAMTRDAPVVRRRIAASVANPPSAQHAAREVIVPCLNALLGRPLGFATIAAA